MVASISERTRANLQLGTIIAVMGAVITAAWWGRGQVESMNRRIDEVTKTADGAYSLSAACEQALRQALENPGMRIPDPRDPNRIITVKAADISGGVRTP